jgi:hypothetical protein
MTYYELIRLPGRPLPLLLVVEAAYFGWVISDVVRFREPLPAPGKLGLFEPSAEHLTLLRRRREES